ncbi:alcohol dehydrogenase catalytic domain-containing protein [Blautia schinkii]|nr:alcohol dehydrogenase catalytic domain-containing protein [Blautia schinkii]
MKGTMKAAVFKGIENIVVEELPIPQCPEDGILIKVHFCGICGGDIRNYSNGLRGGVKEQIMGHEISGEIVETGVNVTSWKVGERVALAPDVSCGKCWYCKRGLVNLCQEHKMLGTHFPGGYAQYIALPKEVMERGFVEKIPDEISYREAAFAEPVSGVVACHKRIGTSAGDTVVIIGDGPIGCVHIEVAHAFGAKAVILGRRKLARTAQFGPDLMVQNSNPESAVKEVLDFTEGIGADYVIVAAPNVEPQMQALKMVRKRGTVVIYGGAPKNACMAQLDSNLIHYNEITVTGSFSYPAVGLEDALYMIADKKISAEKYLNATVSLYDIADGIRKSKEGEAIKVLINPWLNEK